MCTGRPPFRAGSTMAVLKRVCEDTPRPIREINPEIPDWLAAIDRQAARQGPGRALPVGGRGRRAAGPASGPCATPVGGGPGALPARKRGREGGAASRRGRRWAVAAAVVVCLLGGLSLAEATGVTHVAATVIRIFTPDGTLVVETDDPAVKVTVEGDGGLVITGAGPQEVRLRPGAYKVQAAKDGKPVGVDRDLATITHGDRQVVRVRLEGAEGDGEVRRFEGHEGPIRSVAFSPDGRYCAVRERLSRRGQDHAAMGRSLGDGGAPLRGPRGLGQPRRLLPERRAPPCPPVSTGPCGCGT